MQMKTKSLLLFTYDLLHNGLIGLSLFTAQPIFLNYTITKWALPGATATL